MVWKKITSMSEKKKLVSVHGCAECERTLEQCNCCGSGSEFLNFILDPNSIVYVDFKGKRIGVNVYPEKKDHLERPLM